nr:Peptidase M12A domain containing protein [Haemonchus contortus]
MRLILLTLLLAVAVSGDFLRNVEEQPKEVLKRESNFVQKLKTGFQKFLDETGLSRIADKFKKVKEKVVKTLKLSPELLKSLKERLKNLRLFKRNRIQEGGDSITEINAFNKVENDFYQADIALTSTQAEEIITGIEQQAGEVNRAKRQAFKDSHYPNTVWFEGVNYFFDPAARTAAHELGHALGFFHTMSRYDRDKYITVNTENIKPDWIEQFNKETKQTNENYGMTYDYGSIMHYGGTRFPAGCGAIIKATPEWQELEDIVGPGTEEQEDFYTCNYWLESPPDTLIEVRILDFTAGVSVDGCTYAGVEIKTNKDQTLTGYRFCSPEAAGMELRSYTNRVPIITWNRVYKTETVLEFRYVSSSGKPMGKDNKEKKVRPPVITGNGFKCVDHKE